MNFWIYSECGEDIFKKRIQKYSYLSFVSCESSAVVYHNALPRKSSENEKC